MNGTRHRLLNRLTLPLVMIGVAGLAGAGGCGPRARALTPGAEVVAAGLGTVEYTAVREGYAYIIDTRTNEIIGMGNLKEGQTARVDALADTVATGEVINRRPIDEDRLYQIRFNADDDPRPN